MTNKRTGFIYRISGEGCLPYFGSTFHIGERISHHKGHYKEYLEGRDNNLSCFEIFEKDSNWVLEAIEEVETDNDKIELLTRERWWIENNECINKIKRPIRTEEEAKEQRRQYQKEHKEDLREYKKNKATEYRRAKGIEPKNPNYDDKKCKADWAKAKRASLTPEERDKINARKRELRALKKEVPI